MESGKAVTDPSGDACFQPTDNKLRCKTLMGLIIFRRPRLALDGFVHLQLCALTEECISTQKKVRGVARSLTHSLTHGLPS